MKTGFQNFSSLAATQTDLGKFKNFFKSFQEFYFRKNQNFEVLKKVLIRASQEASFTKILAI